MLVVHVVVDQLRADMLDRYRDVFTEGLDRLLEDGLVVAGASHRHSETTTAVGHATLVTGVVPARHGIVGNTWWERTPDGTLVSVYAVADSTSPLLGLPGAAGRSPSYLLRGGLPDWILARDSDARVVSLSTKDRAAITMAGRAPGHVYWLESDRFVTSEHYRGSYPDWVESFNAERMPALVGDSVWQQEVPSGFRSLARPDPAAYEGDAVHTVFPHLRRQEAAAGDRGRFLWVREWTPWPDRAVLELADRAVDELALGRRGVVDYLGLSFSQTDYVGHQYGPLSQEQLDNLYRLDRTLGELIDMLDRRVGAGRWVLGLSSDHGVLTAPEWLEAQGETARRLTRDELRGLRATALEAANRGGDARAIQDRVVAAVESLDFVDRVYRASELEARSQAGDTIAGLFLSARREDRLTGSLAAFGLHLVYEPNVLARPGTG
ncbi:MAG: alkaline phosphatase family protein, partial [Gemmatimonadota bacterium]